MGKKKNKSAAAGNEKNSDGMKELGNQAFKDKKYD